MSTSNTGVLQIVGAAYGLAQVTSQVIGLVCRQTFPESLSILVSDRGFGDTWTGTAKTLTVVYRYDDGPTHVAVAMEGETLEIGVPQFEQAAVSPDSSIAQQSLTIWGASYGCLDVTEALRGMVIQPAGTLNLVAGDATFGSAGHAACKALVIVASYAGQVPFVDIVIENTSYALQYRPPLEILNAFYGLKDVTDVVRANVSRRQLAIAASDGVLDEGGPGTPKSLHVIYQYGDRRPQLATAREHQVLAIDDVHVASTPGASFDARALNIIAAAYGSADVTDKVAAMVEEHGLSFTADSATLGDVWPGVTKSFSMVYSWGAGAVESIHVAEGVPVFLTRPEPAFAEGQRVVSLAGLFAVGDDIKLQGAAGGYWSLAPDGRIVARESSNDAAEVFTVGVPGAAGSAGITLQCQDGSFVSMGADGILHAGGSAQDAVEIAMSLHAGGAIHIGIVGGSGAACLAVAADGAIAVNGSNSSNAGSAFNLLLNPTQAGGSNHMQAFAGATMLDGPVDMKLVKVVWDLTGGCFQAIGLGPLPGNPQQIGPGLYRFLRRHPRVMNRVAILIATMQTNRAASVGSLLTVLRDVYEAEILMPVLRMALSSAGWVDVAWAIVTVLDKVLGGAMSAGATAVTELAASFDGWAYQTTMDVLDYMNSMGGAALMLAYERMINAEQPVLRRTPASVVPGPRARTGPQDYPGAGRGPLMRTYLAHA